MKRVIFALIVATAALVVWFAWQQYSISQIDTFDECAARYPVMETYPARCVANGETFVGPR